MFKQWNSCPFILRRKCLLTLLSGTAGLVVSIVVYLTTNDHILLALGSIIFLACILYTKGILSSAVHGRYDVVTGICTGIYTPILRRYRKVFLLDEQGGEVTLLLNKSNKVQIGSRYRFYFQKESRPVIGNDYLDTALSAKNFLGYEELEAADEKNI